MKVIAVLNQKGGSGKTTIATHLAAHSALQGKRTVLADADPQGSATRWAERRAELESAVLPIDASRRRAWRDRPRVASSASTCPRRPSGTAR